jgi:hypothetical protein
LAKKSKVFTDFYVASSVCSPSRWRDCKVQLPLRKGILKPYLHWQRLVEK